MQLIPSEVSLWGVYFPPLFFATIIGMVAAALTALALNRFRLSRYLYYPPAVFLALTVIYTGFIGTFILPV
jgi:hypothetical protein